MARQQKKIDPVPDASTLGLATTLEPAMLQVISSSDIAALAYELWHARGCPEGSPEIDWFQAETQLRERTAGVRPAINEPLLMRGTVA